MKLTRIGALAIALLAAACAAPVAPPTGPGPVGQPTGRWQAQTHWVPARDADGTPRLLHALVCRPAAGQDAPVMVLAHGTGPDYLIQRPFDCDTEAVRWFLDRGYAVISSVRRGYGATGGRVNEFAILRNGTAGCDAVDPYRAGLETARDIAATLAYALALPGIRKDGAVVLGGSTGGFGAIAYSRRAPATVAAIINVSGGRGGAVNGSLGNVCHPDRLIDAASRYGAGAHVPTLWLYAANDGYFSPQLGREMVDAYTQAGGRAEFVQLGTFGADGHATFFSAGGPTRWGASLDAFLAKVEPPAGS